MRYIIANDRIELIASQVGGMIAQNNTGTINFKDVQFYHDSAMLTFPQLLSDAYRNRGDWTGSISISMATVDFGPVQKSCGSTCTYTPKMVWSGGNVPRSCSTQMTAVSDTAPPSPTTLPAHIYGPGASVVVDVTYLFVPLLQSKFFSGFTIKRSYYIAPRFVSLIKYSKLAADNAIAQPCPGYT